MSKINLNPLSSLTNEQSALSSINVNYDEIETKSDTFLSRDGSDPNQMESDLDMNSNRILNLPEPVSEQEPLRLKDLADFNDLGTIDTGISSPGSSTEDALVRWEDTDGEVVTNSHVTLSDAGILTFTGTPAVILADTSISFVADSADGVVVTPTSLRPGSNDSCTLGTSTLNWSDLFLADGGKINWNNGDIVLTHSNDTLTLGGSGAGGSVSLNSTGELTASTSLTTPNIVFPATQVPSADVHTLDDYEEGTFTPTITFATPGDLAVSYTTQSGHYTKIGRMVFVQLQIVTSSFTHSTASGIFRIAGFPFAAANSVAGPNMSFGGYTKANYTHVQANSVAGNTLFQVVASGSGQTSAFLQAADIPSGGLINILMTGGYPV